MGSRGNIKITQPWSVESIYFYTHHDGHVICESLARGVYMAHIYGRTDDPTYATRIIFDELTQCARTATGYAISIGELDDNEYPVPAVSWTNDHKMLITYESVTYTPQQFIDRYLPSSSKPAEAHA